MAMSSELVPPRMSRESPHEVPICSTVLQRVMLNMIMTDNNEQATGRFGKGGEVLFDKICRHNGITHRLTQSASPTTTGKIERFHLALPVGSSVHALPRVST